MPISRKVSVKLPKQKVTYPDDWFVPDTVYWEVAEGVDFFVSVNQFRTQLHQQATILSLENDRLITVETSIAKPIPKGSIEFKYHDRGPLTPEDRRVLEHRHRPYKTNRPEPAKVTKGEQPRCDMLNHLRIDCLHCAQGNPLNEGSIREWRDWWEVQLEPGSKLAAQKKWDEAEVADKLVEVEYANLVRRTWKERGVDPLSLP